VRFTPLKLSSGLLLALLTGVVLITGGSPVYAQTNTRSIQMALWGYQPPNGASHDTNVDIATFWAPQYFQPAPGTQPQPAAPLRTILVGHTADMSLTPEPYDWSRIVAVEFDEPYSRDDGGIIDSDESCLTPTTETINDINNIASNLQTRATELKALAPKARFWVNLTMQEARWIANGCGSPLSFNKAFIDVISFDWYSFPWIGDENYGVSTAYADVLASLPKTDQQVALIPGVYSAPIPSQLMYLPAYLASGNNMNQTCNLPLGSRGVTGYFDGCPVWIVMGFLPYNTTSGPLYVGMLEPNSDSEAIAQVWQAQAALPLSPALAHQRKPAQLMQPILQLLLQ
jgi:hypothetical protein